MYTVSGLARQCGLSRTAILYYESLGLLRPAARTAGNYRQYGERELERLRQICAHRNLGLSLADIRAVVGRRRARPRQRSSGASCRSTPRSSGCAAISG